MSPRPPLRRELLRWFDRHQRDLPWRKTSDPYAIWLSEVMLQQTQVATVIPYWERFLQRFPTVESLAAAPLDDVLSLWRGLGYYSRARNLHRCAQKVAHEHGGRFPRSAKGLEALPGLGRYTAGAVASIAFGEAAPLVDGNVARVFSRLFEIEGRPGEPAREATLWRTAESLVKGERPGAWNQALMELGALVCRSENPSCLLCPVRSHCGAHRAGRVEELPPPKLRAARKRVSFALALFTKGEALLLARRGERGLFGGLWELPSVELEEGAAPAEALARALGSRARVSQPLASVKRTLTHRDLELHVFGVKGRVPTALEGYQTLRWCSPEQVASLGMSTAMARALETALRQERSGKKPFRPSHS